MTTFVLIPGAWIGAWAWQDVAADLRARGHLVYPLSLTGLAERVHLGRPDTNLDTHLDDVVKLLEFEDLRDIVLVGHSYAGCVITGVADRAPDRLAALVYCDTGRSRTARPPSTSSRRRPGRVAQERAGTRRRLAPAVSGH